MSSSRGVVGLSDISSWYDIHHKQQVQSAEDSEYAFNESLNKRVALIVGMFLICLAWSTTEPTDQIPSIR